MKKFVLSMAALVIMSTFAVAEGDVPSSLFAQNDESNFYLGVGITAVSTRDARVSLDFFNVKNGQDRLGNFSLFAGYEFNEYIAFDGRYTTTYTKEDLVEMSGWSLFVKPQYPIGEDFHLYALIGYGAVKLEAVNESTVDVDDSGFQWGIGLTYDLMDNASIFIDYTSLANDMEGMYYNGALEVNVNAINVGAIYKF